MHFKFTHNAPTTETVYYGVSDLIEMLDRFLSF